MPSHFFGPGPLTMATENAEKNELRPAVDWRPMLAGAISGSTTTFLLQPFDVVKTRQVSVHAGTDCMQSLK